MRFDFLQSESPIESLRKEAQRDGITLFGAGNFAISVLTAVKELDINVHACVVSGPGGGRIENVPILSLQDLNESLRGLPMWLAVFNRNAESDLVSLAAVCTAQGIAPIRMPQDYFETIQHQMGWRFWLSDRRHYKDARNQIEDAYGMLQDESSQQQFIETLRFRLGLSPDIAPQPVTTPQYFPDELLDRLCSGGHPITFVDGGAYDGDTLVQATSRLPLGSAFAFEPDESNFHRLTQRVRSLQCPVVCLPCGLSAHTERQSFSADNGESSAVKTDGHSTIQCVALDDCLVGQSVDFIKLDVEGYELQALNGALGIIASQHPALAIAAYHRCDDLWRIPAFLRCHAPGYRLIYRTHEYNTFDSVFYAQS